MVFNFFKKCTSLLNSAGLLIIFTIAITVTSAKLTFDKLVQYNRIAVGEIIQTVLKTTQSGIHIWAQMVRSEAQSWAKSVEVIQATKSQLYLMHNSKNLNSHTLLDLQKSLNPVLHQDHEFTGFSIVAPNKLQIASNIEKSIGKKWPQQHDLKTVESALAGKTTLGLPFMSEHGPEILVATPIKNAKKIVAALVFYLNPSSNFTHFTQLGRIGQTGETYAFDSSGRMVTQSRFDNQLKIAGLIAYNKQSILNVEIRDPGVNLLNGEKASIPRTEQPFTHMACSALNGNSGHNLDGYRDYRGVQVVGAWLWDSNLKIGLVTEIDKDEAFRSVHVEKKLIIFMIAIILISFLFAFFLIYDRNRILANMVAIEKKAVSDREQIIHIVSHDLKSPLNTITLNLSLIKSKTLTDANEQNIEIIKNAVQQMARLASDLLIFSKIDAGKLTYELSAHSVSFLVEKAIAQHFELARTKNVRLVPIVETGLGQVFADTDRVGQILSNLLTNAIKFSRKNSEVVVRVTRTKEEACFSVTDQGLGIAPEAKKHLFERYWQAGKANGTGLGLYISKKMVEAQGGRIWVESTVHQGSTFFFTLPFCTD